MLRAIWGMMALLALIVGGARAVRAATPIGCGEVMKRNILYEITFSETTQVIARGSISDGSMLVYTNESKETMVTPAGVTYEFGPFGPVTGSAKAYYVLDPGTYYMELREGGSELSFTCTKLETLEFGTSESITMAGIECPVGECTGYNSYSAVSYLFLDTVEMITFELPLGSSMSIQGYSFLNPENLVEEHGDVSRFSARLRPGKYRIHFEYSVTGPTQVIQVPVTTSFLPFGSVECGNTPELETWQSIEVDSPAVVGYRVITPETEETCLPKHTFSTIPFDSPNRYTLIQSGSTGNGETYLEYYSFARTGSSFWTQTHVQDGCTTPTLFPYLCEPLLSMEGGTTSTVTLKSRWTSEELGFAASPAYRKHRAIRMLDFGAREPEQEIIAMVDEQFKLELYRTGDARMKVEGTGELIGGKRRYRWPHSSPIYFLHVTLADGNAALAAETIDAEVSTLVYDKVDIVCGQEMLKNKIYTLEVSDHTLYRTIITENHAINDIDKVEVSTELDFSTVSAPLYRAIDSSYFPPYNWVTTNDYYLLAPGVYHIRYLHLPDGTGYSARLACAGPMVLDTDGVTSVTLQAKVDQSEYLNGWYGSFSMTDPDILTASYDESFSLDVVEKVSGSTIAPDSSEVTAGERTTVWILDAGEYLARISSNLAVANPTVWITMEVGAPEPLQELRYDFAESMDGWAVGGSAAFASVEAAITAGNVRLSATGPNAFGYFDSPLVSSTGSEGSVPLMGEGDCVLIETTLSAPASAAMPTVRLRASSSDFAMSEVLVVEPAGDATYSPSNDGDVYTLLSMIPGDFRASVDLLSFGPDSGSAMLDVEELTMMRVPAPGSFTEIELAPTFPNWIASGAAPVFSVPSMSRGSGGLSVSAVEGAAGTSFGFWSLPGQQSPVTLEAGRIYGVSCTVKSSSATRSANGPALRFRVNSADLQLGAYQNIETKIASSSWPTEGGTAFTFWFVCPDQVAGEKLTVAFDFIHQGAADGVVYTLSDAKVLLADE